MIDQIHSPRGSEVPYPHDAAPQVDAELGGAEPRRLPTAARPARRGSCALRWRSKSRLPPASVHVVGLRLGTDQEDLPAFLDPAFGEVGVERDHPVAAPGDTFNPRANT